MADLISGSSGTWDNISSDISFDKDYDIINSYNFVLRVEAMFNVAVKSVRGINKQNEYEYIQEGGLNDYVHMVRKQATQPFSFQIERYVSQDIFEDAVDPLANGTELTLPLILYLYRGAKKDGKLPVRYYIFTNARVMGTQIGDLDAEKSGLHTITNTIAYSSLFTFTLPWGTTDTDNMYQFDPANIDPVNAKTLKDIGITDGPATLSKAEMEANAIGYTPPDPIGQLFKDEMEEKAIKYDFKGEPTGRGNIQTDQTKATSVKYTGEPTGRGNTQKDETSKDDMEANAEKYKYNDPVSDNVKVPERQLSKLKMKRKAEKYRYPGKHTKHVVQPKGQRSKKTMEGKAKQYEFGDEPSGHAKTPDDQLEKKEMESNAIRYVYGDAPSDSVKVPEEQLSKSDMEGKARKYPPTRSARQVSDFLKS